MKKIFISLSLLFTVLLTACVGNGTGGAFSMFQAPKVSLLSLTPKTVNNGKLAFDIGLNVQNPNALPLPINDVNSNIALNGLSLLSAKGASETMIPANGSGNITLSTAVSLDKIQQLAQTLKGGNINYQLNGDVGVTGTGNLIRLPFNQSGSVNAAELAQTLIKSQLGL